MQNFGEERKIMRIYANIAKPAFDITTAFSLIILISPLLLIIIILLFIFNSGAGVFFCQSRPGKNEKIFKIIKFKTMNEKRDKDGKLLPDVQRITPFGRFIRNSSIDELPQLFNVLIGDMSFIGPRPLLPEYLPLYSEFQKQRHNVKPGITGWAQVNGRNNTTWKERFENDVWYANNISFKTDAIIIYKTIFNILKKKDIESNTCRKYTMEPFNGNN